MARICIPDHEYKERVQKCAAILRRKGLDALIVNGNEADYANPRYFSGYWPLFERAGVAISAGGDAALMVGPESAEFGRDRNKLDKIFVLKAYREGADPSYPELRADTYEDVFKAIGVTGKKLRIGVASFLDTSVTIYQAIRDAFPEAELINAGEIMRHTKRILALLLCLALALSLAACSTGGKSQTASASQSAAGSAQDILNPVGTYPIVKEPIELRVFTISAPNVEDLATNDFTKYLEQKTGVKLTFETATRDNWEEKLNLVLSTNDYPDIVMTREDYRRYFEEFNPRSCDPRRWVRAAKEAGMEYVVLTAKHHDGFCLFDSALTDFKSVNTACGRDFVAEFTEAARAEGLRVGLYYSLLDWDHPDYPHQSDRIHPMLRRNVEWCRALPEEVFLHHVAYYRVNTENIEPNRGFFFSLLYPLVLGLPADRAALEINYWCAAHVRYVSNDRRTASPLTLYRAGEGRCGEESAFAVTALRSVGLPARQVYAPWWAHCDDNHAWVELFTDGAWHFMSISPEWTRRAAAATGFPSGAAGTI